MKKSLLMLFSVLTICIIVASCSETAGPTPIPPTKGINVVGDANTYSSDVATDWLNMTLLLTKVTPGTWPFNAGKQYGYTFFSLYEAVAPGMTNYKSLSGSVTDYKGTTTNIDSKLEYNWEVVAYYNMKTIIAAIYGDPTGYNAEATAKYNEITSKWEGKFQAQFTSETGKAVCDRSTVWGKAVADDIIAYMKTDYAGKLENPSNNLIIEARNKPLYPAADYEIPGDQYWRRANKNQPALLPYWGKTRTFSPLNSNGTFAYGKPMAFDTVKYSPFWNQARITDSLVKYTRNFHNSGKTEDSAAFRMWNTGKYWNDDPQVTSTPGGHSMAVAREIVKTANYKLGDAALSLAMAAMAQSDAFVICARIKYDPTLSTIRPITYSERYLKGLDTSSFTTIINTPPFPEWASCHSTQSSAAIVALSDRVGNNFTFTDSNSYNKSGIDYIGTPRTYTNLDAMVWEVASARVYGGVHFVQACNDGVANGKTIGNNVLSLRWRK